MRERLGVVHDGRRAMHALLGRKGRLAAREGEAALDARDHRRFLAADVEARARHDRERQRAAEQRVRSPRTAGARAIAARPRATTASARCSCGLTYRTTWLARVATAAMSAPSITWCGVCSSRKRSLNVPGSSSLPLQMTYLSPSGAAATGAHLRCGREARRRPCRAGPPARSSAMIAAGIAQGLGKPFPAAAREPGIEVGADPDVVPQQEPGSACPSCGSVDRSPDAADHARRARSSAGPHRRRRSKWA